nr:immunoglobulin heavy chain junction region [Macaca mulatta]MOY21138.1 immunoglobulin heavy chain junction region [Macaca mulatta]MOY24648.1 immunoglobulin heavy chain junction region [Macaca mulatta]
CARKTANYRNSLDVW